MKKKYEKELCYRQPRMHENNIYSKKEAIESFFSNFSLQDARNHLWEFYQCCVGHHCSQGTHHEEAADALFFYTEIEMLVEATWLMWQSKNDNKEV